jgi:hypothetical protein
MTIEKSSINHSYSVSLIYYHHHFIVLSDAELEESLENLPLLIAQVEQRHWIK